MFPYFHLNCKFMSQSYDPFTIESVVVNGQPAAGHRILQGSRPRWARPKQIRAIEVNDNKITTADSFVIEIPYQWESGDEVEVVVTGKTESGQRQLLKAKSKKPASSAGIGLKGWKHSAAIVITETAGVQRKGSVFPFEKLNSRNAANSVEHLLLMGFV